MKRSAVPTVVLVAAIALVALLVYGVVQRGDNRTLDDAVRQGERPTAPGQSRELPTLGDDARKQDLAAYRGKVVVLNFWASWCVPCDVEAPVLEKTQRALGSAGTVLGATYNDTPDASERFVREHGLSYPNLRDVGTDLAHAYGTKSLPETFVLDRTGHVVAISRGQVSQGFLDHAVAEAKAGPA